MKVENCEICQWKIFEYRHEDEAHRSRWQRRILQHVNECWMSNNSSVQSTQTNDKGLFVQRMRVAKGTKGKGRERGRLHGSNLCCLCLLDCLSISGFDFIFSSRLAPFSAKCCLAKAVNIQIRIYICIYSVGIFYFHAHFLLLFIARQIVSLCLFLFSISFWLFTWFGFSLIELLLVWGKQVEDIIDKNVISGGLKIYSIVCGKSLLSEAELLVDISIECWWLNTDSKKYNIIINIYNIFLCRLFHY